MSGGFFRGTSADQDTRFSNKQAKLLKTQKFPPELEHLVDITKVKMDVIRPWIANRVTELLGGFEDEVLINFIYGLLEGKEINGKQVQIQLTGFMEKNTGKFMKELWALLLSAEKNASGVPQQFLDAKEEETRKKKAETDRIFSEIQKRKEKETEQEKMSKMDGGLDNISAEESNRRRVRSPDGQSGDENGADVRNGFRRRNRSSKSPYSSDRSPLPHRRRSISKSHSNSRSYSKERSISRSVSGSPRPRRRSVSHERIHRSPQRRAISPRRLSARESISPRRRSHSRRRSSSRARYESPSPIRRRFRSPARRRSPSPVRRRSPYFARRRSPSPLRHRSRSPLRRRSPPRLRRSPSPWRRRSISPRRRRSPLVRQRRRRSTSSPRSRSPVKSPSPARRRFRSPGRRSAFPVRRRSPSPRRRVSQSPGGRSSLSPGRRRLLSPDRRRPPAQGRRRSPTPSLSRSLSPASRTSASPARHSSGSPVKTKSPGHQKSPRGSSREGTRNNDPAMMVRRQPITMSPQRDQSDRSRSRRKVPSVSPSPEKSLSYPERPRTRTRDSGEDRSLVSSYGGPSKRTGDRITFDGSQSPPAETRDRVVRQSSPTSEGELEYGRKDEQDKHKSAERRSARSSGDKRRESPDKHARRRDIIDLRLDNNGKTSVDASLKEVRALKSSPLKGSVSGERPVSLYTRDGSKSDEKRNFHSKDAVDNSRSDALANSLKKPRSPSSQSDFGSEGSDKEKSGVGEKRKHRRSSRREPVSDDSSSESEMEDRKEAKRRRKEEKKLRKEERRRRREERRRRREEKRASKRKRKSKDADALSSEMEKHEKDANDSNGGRVMRKHSSEEEDTESQKKRLEIELREKALESLRAKKGISR